jgi:hypothetical protein
MQLLIIKLITHFTIYIKIYLYNLFGNIKYCCIFVVLKLTTGGVNEIHDSNFLKIKIRNYV